MAAPASKSYYFHHTNSSAAGENSGATSSAFSNKTTRGKTTAATNNSGTTISSTTAVLTESCYNSTSSCSTSTLLHNNIVNSTCDDVNALMMNSTGGHDQLVEREVAEDAQWKRIQQNTFTRWANQHLKEVGCSIQNLETDLSDGLLLIRLVEILSHKRLPKHSKRPQFRSQKLENVSVAINFLENVEKIKLVNIDSSDIVDQRLKLILGLIWTLILHYSISMPMLDEDMNGSATETAIKETPKQRLLGWIQAKIPDVSVTNFTSDWQNGRALGALVESVAPGLASDWPTWSKRDALENTTHAMNLADNWLGVAKLIEPHEMINPKVDEMSVMTYLSQYPNARLKPGAPIGVTKAKSDPQRVRAYGPGIQPNGVKSGSVTHFTVDAQQPGPASVSCFIRNPAGQFEPVEITTNNEKSSHYTVTYAPQMQGPHQVIVKYNNFEIPGSPFPVSVESAAPVASDVSKVTVAGPGVEPGVMTEKPTYFEIYTKDNTGALPEVVVLPPSGSAAQPLQPPIRRISDNVYRCEYVASEPGLHSLNVLYANQHIPCSPVGVTVLPSVDPRNVRCWGRGVQPKGIRVGDRADFKVYTDGAGDGQLDVKVKTPTGLQERVERRDTDATTSAFGYQPKTTGVYTVDVTYGGHPVPKSPFKVSVAADVPSLIRAYGPGLETGVANLPCEFSVETNGETGSLGFSVEGPSQAKISCKDNGDGSAEISYLPTTAGDYAVHVLCNDEDIPGSPYMVNVQPYHEGFMPSMVRCSGPGLERKGVLKGQTAPFFVDAQNAGKAPLKVVGLDRDYDPVPVEVKDNQNGTFSCCYEPKTATPHTIQISYGGVAVPGSPYRVFVQEPVDPTKVKVFGPGVETGVKSKTPTHFIIDCKQAGPGEVEVALSDDKGAAVDIDVLDNSDGSFTVKYTAPKPGPYNVRVVFAHSEIPGSPIRLNVQPHLDVGGIRVEGLDTTPVIVNTEKTFHIITNDPTKMGEIKIIITSPTGRRIEAVIEPTKSGFRVRFTPSELGDYTIEILVGEAQVLDRSPFILSSVPASALKKRRASSNTSPATKGGPQMGGSSSAGRFLGGDGIEARTENLELSSPSVSSSSSGDQSDRQTNRQLSTIGRTNQSAELPTAQPMRKSRAAEIDTSPSPKPFRKTPPFKAAPAVPRSPRQLARNVFAPVGDGLGLTSSEVKPEQVSKMGQNLVPGGHCVGHLLTPSDPLVPGIPPPDPTLLWNPTISVLDAEGLETLEPLPIDDVEVNQQSEYLTACDSECVEPMPEKVTAFGDGLNHGISGQSAHFVIDTRGAGQGNIDLTVEGPSEARIECSDNRDGTCIVTYFPTLPGRYQINVLFADLHIPGSPFISKVLASPLTHSSPSALSPNPSPNSPSSALVRDIGLYCANAPATGLGKANSVK